MVKLKYIVMLVLILIISVAFMYQSSTKTMESYENSPDRIQAPVPDFSYEIASPLSKYDSILSTGIRETGTVGAAVVITYKNNIALLKCFGVKKVGGKDSVDHNTVFRLASVSKTITGVLTGILEAEDVIDLDDKVIDYLPGLKLKNPGYTSSLSLKHLLNHTSGLVPHAYDLMVEDHVPLNKIIERLDEVDHAAPPGELYGYQNVMFSIIDPVLKKKTNKSFDNLLREKVFLPFGMRNATTGFQLFKSNANKAFPHFGGDNNFRSMRLNNRYYITSPAAGINASISDLGSFLIHLTNQESDVFTKEMRELIVTPQVNSPLSRRYLHRWDKVDSKAYSIGWRVLGYKGRKVAYHGGFVSGYRAEIAFCPEEQLGIAYLTNSPNSFVSKSVPEFLNLVFEYKDSLKALDSAMNFVSP